ncbi:hypothetical protein ACPOL_2560 [Acidisarcina polymorpha]|uniref:Uncharacterized protein n=1 Tax=Acidisarcina polymorpha TaxID=2211140 RepID=A0A2Z5FYU7_9BACT|nr:DUF6152 family protein [Acidisarcina polymorpha]AXC11880.1 hypothetical protein ACPOL_2560 [Acidisarcina polymorpha]
MKKHLLTAALLFSMAAGSTRSFAHHSFAAEYDASKPITLNGKLTKLSWVNPHGWIYVDVVNPDKTVTSWAVEFGSPNALLRRGLRETDFPLGIDLTINGYLAKNGKKIINGTSVKLPDGRSLFTGSVGTGAPGDPGVAQNQ